VTVDTTALVALAAIQDAAHRLRGVVKRTPLLPAPELSRRLGVPVRLKCEQFQAVGAFKIRGAYNALARLSSAELARGVVTHSSGNHGQAVAYAARTLGVRAVVVMPASAARVKVDGVRRLGGEVVTVALSTEREVRAEELVKAEGLILIPPYESLDVIAGQATCGLEIIEEWPEVRTILVPVGGGGLIAGIARAVAASGAEVAVIGVEPIGAAKLSAALQAGHPVRLEHTASLADGLLPRSIGRLAFAQMDGVVREAVTVADADLALAVRFLHQEAGLRVEPSGAATTAALLSGRCRPAGPTVGVISGGNVDPELFAGLVS